MPQFNVAESMEIFYSALAAGGWTEVSSQPDEWQNEDGQFEILIQHTAGSCTIRYRRTVKRLDGDSNESYYARRKAASWNTLMRAYGTRREFESWLVRACGTIGIYVQSMSVTAEAPGE